MKIEIVIGSGIGLFAESAGHVCDKAKGRDIQGNRKLSTSDDCRWHAIRPIAQSVANSTKFPERKVR